MTFLDAAIGMNNIQNLRHGASGGERAKNIGALVGKIAGTTLLAAGMIGGLAKLGSTTASLIRKDVLWQEHRLLNPLEKYGKKRKLSKLSKMFPQHRRDQHPSLTRSLWHSLFPFQQRGGPSRIESLSAPDRYSFLRPTPPRSATWRDWWIERNLGRPNQTRQTLARIVEARGDEANAYHQAIRQNYIYEQQSLQRRQIMKQDEGKHFLIHGKYLVPKNQMTPFFEPPLPQETPTLHFVADRRTTALNSILSDYESNSLVKYNKTANRIQKQMAMNENLFLDALFDETRTQWNLSDDLRSISMGKSSYLQRQRQNFMNPFLREKYNAFINTQNQIRQLRLKIIFTSSGVIVISGFITGLTVFSTHENTNPSPPPK